MSDTLILNADAQPISILPLSAETWKEAVKLMFVDRADVIAEYADWEVHSPSMTIKVPSVILLKEYIKVSRSVKYCRDNILLRDSYTCQYCGLDCDRNHDDLTLDHVIPRFHGGKTTFTNIVAACSNCNLEKAHYMKMKPKKIPVRPTYYQLVQKRMQRTITIPDESWVDFIGWDPSLIIYRKPNKF
jgi:5-methylcytosine-specific restriction endonuclease McrA